MIDTEREKLYNKKSDYLSIGITEGGAYCNSTWVPWEVTAHAFNMRTPDVYISPSDLSDEEIMNKISSFKLIGCYIKVPLEDYSFLAKFKDLQDISIMNGEAIRDLDFLTDLKECGMLYLQNAKLKNIDIIAELSRNRKSLFGGLRCVCLDNCEVEDLSVFESHEMQFSEFLVMRPEGSDEREKWSAVPALTFRYYEYKE